MRWSWLDTKAIINVLHTWTTSKWSWVQLKCQKPFSCDTLHWFKDHENIKADQRD